MKQATTKRRRTSVKTVCTIKQTMTPARVSRAPYVFAIYRETARALEAAAFSVPRASTCERPQLLATVDALKDAMQAAKLRELRAACEAAEAIPLARRFPCALAWTRFLARVAPEQTALAL